MATQVYKITRYDPQPVLFGRPEPILDTSGLALTEKINLAKKENGFIPPTSFTPGLTFGVIGDDTNLYPSSHWQSEAQSRYLPSTSEKEDNDKHNFLITSLDTRAHNPQSKRIFHIKRINHEPVCKVLTWPLDAEQSGEGIKTVYSTSYPIKIRKEPRRLILRHSLEKRAEGIVPINPAEGFDVRNEMMLPVCDPVVLPSAPNPHRYLIRKRKVPAPTKPAGVIYPPLEPKPIRSAEIMSKGPKSAPFERVSVSSLAGDIFSRRKYIPQPLANMTTGSVEVRPRSDSYKFDDKYLPFIRCKTIIP
ncbi:hypothetical protein CHS0354_015929 [Potamilus streckersoni]|uniref:Uncharacterized protein n=1 Tax=Potamilus streckersoni TaxID=2493646 RepID=A0AAE0VZI3_9BIVA|nr:hypothetical protein CHS0354_015929 [Potamilus streckersoni]